MWIGLPPALGTGDSADLQVIGSARYAGTGAQVLVSDDLDGDGSQDLLINEPSNSDLATWGAAVFIVSIEERGVLQLSSDSLALRGSTDYTEIRRTSTADLNGDGHTDLLLGAAVNAQAFDRGGMAWVVPGPIAESGVVESLASATIAPEGPDEALGYDLTSPGDLDGDGLPDLALSVPRDAVTGEDLPGKVYLFPGTILGSHSGADAAMVLQGENFGDLAGTGLAGGFDADGDGRDDLAIGAPHNDAGGDQAGRVYLFTDLAF